MPVHSLINKESYKIKKYYALSSIVMTEMRLLLLRLFVIFLFSLRVSSLFLFNLRGQNRFAFIYILTSCFSFRFIGLRMNIISKWDKHSYTRGGNIRRREIIHYNKMYFQWWKNLSLKVQFFVAKNL